MKREKAFTRKVDSKTGLKKVKLSDREDFWAFEDGTVRFGEDHILHVYEEWFDDDMGLWWEDKPYVFIGESEHRYFLDDVMKAVGFVQGDKDSLQNPVILHRDNNFRNFASSNLEWVEANDPRYKAYSEKKYSDRKARYEELNKGRILPDFPYWH